ncbi:hypothetical protein KUF57_12390 [Mycolicibacterium sp. PAM1]|uniref:Uncharacterized protein n=1 Tax=Mycolicibacterium gilvum (strain PYR-GCK) TaxID=350054 RepID=A4TBK8_MYCGI|nr:hypothetical protein [Mycolicibacterium sp. PAM1]ABP45401.1 hypothetical protein Mflv_2924 [Mycolicibacterium gilvum PYR-GCK]MBV5244333.1 hypothetical protein [Mycolicibacterium sp. PAM1]
MTRPARTENDWIVQLVNATSVESLDGFVRVEFGDRDYPIYRFESGRLWKSACSIKVWDDDRIHVRAESHLTPRQRRIVAGIAEQAWRGGPQMCRREKWRRIRRSARRPVASWAACFWVLADHEDPGYAAAHADRELVVMSGPDAHDSASAQWVSTTGRDAATDDIVRAARDGGTLT